MLFADDQVAATAFVGLGTSRDTKMDLKLPAHEHCRVPSNGISVEGSRAATARGMLRTKSKVGLV